jgi:protein gp37
VEDQQRADERIPLLLAIPARVRFLSVEPMLGKVTLPEIMAKPRRAGLSFSRGAKGGEVITGNFIHWVICGGESGPGHREFNPDWARSLRDQCASAGVPFFMKQMGGAVKPFPPIPDDLNVREFPRVERSAV